MEVATSIFRLVIMTFTIAFIALGLFFYIREAFGAKKPKGEITVLRTSYSEEDLRHEKMNLGLRKPKMTVLEYHCERIKQRKRINVHLNHKWFDVETEGIEITDSKTWFDRENEIHKFEVAVFIPKANIDRAKELTYL